MGDLISPFKTVMGGNYKDVENRLMSAIYLRFSLPATTSVALKKQMKKADQEATPMPEDAQDATVGGEKR